MTESSERQTSCIIHLMRELTLVLDDVLVL
jgi:hypothetical protein